jgi:Ca2+-binding EF-hand superfamily protein
MSVCFCPCIFRAKEATLEDVKEIINEFDASRDGNLTYDEF